LAISHNHIKNSFKIAIFTPASCDNLNQILDELADDLRKIETNFDYIFK